MAITFKPPTIQPLVTLPPSEPKEPPVKAPAKAPEPVRELRNGVMQKAQQGKVSRANASEIEQYRAGLEERGLKIGTPSHENLIARFSNDTDTESRKKLSTFETVPVSLEVLPLDYYTAKGLDWYQRKVIDPTAARATFGAQLLIPGEQEIQEKVQRGVNVTDAYRSTNFPKGVKGAIELITDPSNLLPGVGVGGLLAKKPLQAAARKLGRESLENVFDNVAVRQLATAERGSLELPSGPGPLGKPKPPVVSGEVLQPDLAVRASQSVPPPPQGSSLKKVMDMWDRQVPPTTPLRERVFDLKRSFEETLLDKFAGINGMTTRVKRAMGVKTLPQYLDAELLVAVTAGAPEAAGQRIRDVLQSVDNIIGDVNPDYLESYLHLRHMKDVVALKGSGRKIAGGLLTPEIDKAAQEMLDELGTVNAMKVKQAADVVQKHFYDILERKVDSGLVSREVADELHRNYPNYNPIKYIEEIAKGYDGVGESYRRISVNRNGLRTLSDIGLEADRERPLASMAKATLESEVLIRRNNAAKATIAAALQDPELKDVVKSVAGMREVRNVAKADSGLPSTQKMFTTGEKGIEVPTDIRISGTTPKGVGILEKKNSITFFENGNRVAYEVPEWLANEAKLFADMPMSKLEKFGHFVNTIPKLAITGANPVFFVRNLGIDTLTAMFTSGVSPLRIGERLAHNLHRLRTGDDLLRHMLRAGGSGAGFSGKSPEELAAAIRKTGNIAVSSEGDWKQLLNPVDFLSKVGRAIELAPRSAVFQREIGRGATDEAAAFAARRSTVDFSRSGTAVKQVNALFMYLNAGVQGTALPFRALRDSVRSRYYLGGFMGMMAANYAWNRQFPEYEDVPSWAKYNAINIMLPSNDYDNQGRPKPRYISIVPNLREFSWFSGPLTYAMAKLDKFAPEDFSAFLGTITSAGNPFGRFAGQGGLPIPTQLGETAAEIVINWDTFRGKPIVPPEMEGLPAEQQFDDRTPESIRRLGKTLGYSPLKLNHWLEGLGGGLGQSVRSGVDSAIAQAWPEEVPANIRDAVRTLESIQPPNIPPDDVALERQRFLNTLSSADREAALNLERKRKPGLPVISELASSVYRTYGGQLYKSGIEQASGETGLSAKQTSQVSDVIGQLSGKLLDEQKLFDNAAGQGFLEYNGERIPYSLEKWRADHQELGKRYGGAMAALGILYPSAAQTQTDPNVWNDYRKQVYTLAGAIPDRRVKGQILTSAYNAIKPEGPTPETMDWGTYYQRKEEFLDGLSEADRAELEEWRTANMTGVEKLYENDQDELKSANYWESHLEIPAVQKYPDLADFYEKYRQMDNPAAFEQAYGTKRFNQMKDIAKVATGIREKKRQNPDVEAALVRWYGLGGYSGDTLQTDRGRKLKKILDQKLAAGVTK